MNDPRCPVGQARVFRDAIAKAGRKEGVDFEYHEFSEEGHASANPEEKRNTLELQGDFFLRTMMGAGTERPT